MMERRRRRLWVVWRAALQAPGERQAPEERQAPGETQQAAAGAGGNAGAVTLPGRVQRPNAIISRTATAFSSQGNGAAVIDGVYHASGWSAGTPSEAAPAWVGHR